MLSSSQLPQVTQASREVSVFTTFLHTAFKKERVLDLITEVTQLISIKRHL